VCDFVNFDNVGCNSSSAPTWITFNGCKEEYIDMCNQKGGNLENKRTPLYPSRSTSNDTSDRSKSTHTTQSHCRFTLGTFVCQTLIETHHNTNARLFIELSLHTNHQSQISHSFYSQFGIHNFADNTSSHISSLTKSNNSIVYVLYSRQVSSSQKLGHS
jgi:hypothetical protein